VALKVQKTDDPLFRKIKSELKMDVHHVFGADGLHRYYIGGFASREEAMSLLQRLKSMKIDGTIKPKNAF
jgi:cell division septation protein DedD